MVTPLVSIGIPTYNRPNGLRHTLECLISQTYTNLHIIVSNNASTVPGYEEVMADFLKKDSRIEYYCQKENLGPSRNFHFVFEKAIGEFFMWAADDDEWHPEFIRHCVEHIGANGTIMTQVEIGAKDNKTSISVPALSADYSKHKNARLFLCTLMPHIIYGLHRRSLIGWIGSFPEAFDYFDCYFGLRQILGPGAIVTNAKYFTTNVINTGHKTKSFSQHLLSRFSYLPFLVNSLKVVIIANDLSPIVKLDLIYHVIKRTVLLYIFNENLLWCKALRVFLRMRLKMRQYLHLNA